MISKSHKIIFFPENMIKILSSPVNFGRVGVNLKQVFIIWPNDAFFFIKSHIIASIK